jgi:hypothetical protein
LALQARAGHKSKRPKYIKTESHPSDSHQHSGYKKVKEEDQGIREANLDPFAIWERRAIPKAISICNNHVVIDA